MLLLIGALSSRSIGDSAERVSFDDNNMIVLFVSLFQKLNISTISLDRV